MGKRDPADLEAGRREPEDKSLKFTGMIDHGDWKLARKLGEGSFGQVFAAVNYQTGSQVTKVRKPSPTRCLRPFCSPSWTIHTSSNTSDATWMIITSTCTWNLSLEALWTA